MSRAFVHNKASPSQYGISTQLQQRMSSTAARSMAAESIAEIDPITTPPATTATTTSTTTASSSTKSNQQVTESVSQGEVLSIKTTPSSTSSFAVVKLLEEDLVQLPLGLSASGLGVAGGADGSVPLVGEEGDKVELANALFGKSKASQEQQSVAGKKNGEGAIANGELTGRTVTFSNSSKGMVVAHRHPIAFVLLDSSSKDMIDKPCSISTNQITLNPSSIPAGSTVDYLGRHVSVLNDGSVSRALPKAAKATATAGEVIDMTTGDGTVNELSLLVDATTIDRPIFVPIPKISDIGLIDSPLVTGITAIDALTPIGKGQNMLVIGQEEEQVEDETVFTKKTGVNKRGWMINLLRNVVENHKGDSSEGGPLVPASKGMRCFYGLTSGDAKVRSSVWNGIKEVGIQDDIVTVVSTRSDDSNNADQDVNDVANVMEAAEAVAIAATACTLGEHHALTTGGDAVVIIDDINLHKSLWDITTQELVQVYGVDAVVAADLNGGSSSEMRGFFSGLIQRAARFNAKKGGGSVTLILLSTLPNPKEDTHASSDDEPTFEASDFDSMADKIKARITMLVKAKVPLTPTNLRKIQIPVPGASASADVERLALQHVDDLISMSDGQVWLDVDLAKQGRSPPLDPSRSLTRVGVGADTRNCRADAPALRSVVGSLRFEFQQAMDVLNSNGSSNASSSSPTAGDTTKQVKRRDAFLLAMHQEPKEVRKLSQECIALLAANSGHLDSVLARGGKAGTEEGKAAMEGLLGYAEKEAGEIMRSIDETLDLSEEERKVLDILFG